MKFEATRELTYSRVHGKGWRERYLAGQEGEREKDRHTRENDRSGTGEISAAASAMCSFLACLSFSFPRSISLSVHVRQVRHLAAFSRARGAAFATWCTAKLARRTPFLRANVASPSGKTDVPRIFPTVVIVCHHYHHHYRHSSLCRFPVWRPKPSPRSSFVSLARARARFIFPLPLSFSIYFFLSPVTLPRVRALFPS